MWAVARRKLEMQTRRKQVEQDLLPFLPFLLPFATSPAVTNLLQRRLSLLGGLRLRSSPHPVEKDQGKAEEDLFASFVLFCAFCL
jgi:hypothetical protein